MRFAIVLSAALALAFSRPGVVGAGKRAKRRSTRQPHTQSGARAAPVAETPVWTFDPSQCNGEWEAGPAKLLLDRCDFEEVSPKEFSAGDFAERFSLRRPVIVRNSSLNTAAREFLARRCAVLERYGSVLVDLGDPFSLAKHGVSTQQMALGRYLELPFSLERPLYFFDRDGRWTESMAGFNDLLEQPPAISLKPSDPTAPIIFAIGKTGSGIGMHQHQDAWNQVLLGMKRWTIYPGDPGGVPPAAGYNPTEPHLKWLETVYPSLDDSIKPLECMQMPGDIVYVPSGWIHATVNVGDTAAIAQRVATFPADSARFKGNLSSMLIKEATALRNPEMALEGLALAKAAVALDPTEGDHRQNLAHAYQTVGQSDEAAHEFENAISLMPSNPTSYFMAGVYLNAKQQWKAALDVLQRGQQMMVAKDSALGDALAKQVKQAEAGLQEPTH